MWPIQFTLGYILTKYSCSSQGLQLYKIDDEFSSLVSLKQLSELGNSRFVCLYSRTQKLPVFNMPYNKVLDGNQGHWTQLVMFGESMISH